ncbi:MAG: RNA repair transcriptional activator RtcR family protein [Bacteroidales bacterium]
MKTLISWLAVNNDLIYSNNECKGINKEGPTCLFHRYYYQHDRHVILCTSKRYAEDADKLRESVLDEFPGRKIEIRNLEVVDPINLNEVKTKVQRHMEKYRNDEVTIFFSPGTSVMQVTWYLVHTGMGMNTEMVQTRAPRHTKTGKPELIRIELEMSDVPNTAVIHEKIVAGDRDYLPPEGEPLITPSLEPVYEKARMVAAADPVTTLILGETGTGKEVLARYIHEHSARKGRPFLAINCSGMSDNLMESRLFGYKKGAFTGAYKDETGLFKAASSGTLFLDEIGDISPYMQQTLLRVIQEKEILPLGGKPEKIDVRLITATNKDLHRMCCEGKFRWDLYYRLTVTELRLPDLLERGPAEVEEYLSFFLRSGMKRMRKKHSLKISPEAMQFLRNYPWPGNIREMENLVESLYVFCRDTVSLNDIPARFRKVPDGESLKMEDVEKAHIRKVLELKKWNKRQAWLALGYKSYNTLINKMEKYGIEEGK